MAPVIERADQLILNYVSKAADAAHGVLRADQRLDFAKRLRARIEQERHGSQSPRDVSRVLARFGDPVVLVEREARRLAEQASAAKPEPQVTTEFPKIRDDAELPPGIAVGRKMAQDRLTRRPGRAMPLAGLRRTIMSSANPMTTEGRDAGTMLREHPRDILALGVLVIAALMVPFNFPSVAIFRVPVMVWAVGALLVVISDSWALRDRLIGISAPLLGYVVGGIVVGGLRVGSAAGFDRFFAEFFVVSGTTFMIGTVLGVILLAYRLFNVA